MQPFAFQFISHLSAVLINYISDFKQIHNMQKNSKQEEKDDYATSKVNVDVIPLDLDIMEQPDVLLTDEQIAEFIVQV